MNSDAPTIDRRAEAQRIAALIDAAVQHNAQTNERSEARERLCLAQCRELARQHITERPELLDQTIAACRADEEHWPYLIFTFYVGLLPLDALVVHGVGLELYSNPYHRRESVWSAGALEDDDIGLESVTASHSVAVRLTFDASVVELGVSAVAYALPLVGERLTFDRALRSVVAERYTVYDGTPCLEGDNLSLDARLAGAWLGLHEPAYLCEHFKLRAPPLPRLLTSEAQFVEAAAQSIGVGVDRYAIFSVAGETREPLAAVSVTHRLDDAGERCGYVFGNAFEGGDGLRMAEEYLECLARHERVYLGQASYETRSLAARALAKLQCCVVDDWY